MRRFGVAALAPAAALVLGGMLAIPASAVPAQPSDCSDFDNQRQAQNYFIGRGGPRRDPDGLDADGNGVACESLPCPCAPVPGHVRRASGPRRSAPASPP
jgi:Excalibur calcium-binding domain